MTDDARRATLGVGTTIAIGGSLALWVWSFQGPLAAAAFAGIWTVIAVAIGAVGRQSRRPQVAVLVGVVAMTSLWLITLVA